MGKQTFSKIKKSLAILLAVLFVVTFMAASASACATKKVDKVAQIAPVAPSNIAPVDANGLTEEQKTALGNQLLDWANDNWFGKGGDWLGSNLLSGNDGNCGCDNNGGDDFGFW